MTAIAATASQARDGKPGSGGLWVSRRIAGDKAVARISRVAAIVAKNRFDPDPDHFDKPASEAAGIAIMPAELPAGPGPRER
jgi:hypothetical protein